MMHLTNALTEGLPEEVDEAAEVLEGEMHPSQLFRMRAWEVQKEEAMEIDEQLKELKDRAARYNEREREGEDVSGIEDEDVSEIEDRTYRMATNRDLPLYMLRAKVRPRQGHRSSSALTDSYL